MKIGGGQGQAEKGMEPVAGWGRWELLGFVRVRIVMGDP